MQRAHLHAASVCMTVYMYVPTVPCSVYLHDTSVCIRVHVRVYIRVYARAYMATVPCSADAPMRLYTCTMHLCVYIRVPCSVRIHVYVQHPCTCVPDRCAGRVGQDKLAKFVISVAPSRGHTLRRCAHPLCVSCLSFCGSLPGVFWLGSRCAACFSVA